MPASGWGYLVSCLVNADQYKARNGKVFDKKVATKKLAIAAIASKVVSKEVSRA